MDVYSLKYKSNDKKIKLVYSEEYTDCYDGSADAYMESRFEFCEKDDVPFLTTLEKLTPILEKLNDNKNYEDIDMCMISGERKYEKDEFELVKYELTLK